MNSEFNECPVCSSQDFTNSGKPVGSESDSVYSVIECSVCNLNWCSPIPTEKELNEYYARYYEIRYSTVDKYPLKTKLKSIITLRHARLKTFFSLIEKFSPGKSILDFRYGEADILYIAKEKGWKVLGLDYSNELSEKFKSDNIEFRCASNLDLVGIEKNSISCISAKHVLEHIPEIENFLNSVREYLAPKGVLAVKIPSASATERN